VCATFHFTDLELLEEILSKEIGLPLPSALLHQLQQRIPIFYHLFAETGSMTPSLCPVVRKLLEIAKKNKQKTKQNKTKKKKNKQKKTQTFEGIGRSNDFTTNAVDNSPLACCPSLKINRSRGHYVADTRNWKATCKKKGTTECAKGYEATIQG
jgi:hypothetical protein